MSGMLNVLVLLCGLDYSKGEYKQCIKKTKACYESNSSKIKPLKQDDPLSEEQKNLFYKCYSAGYVGEAKSLKRK